MGAAGVAFLCGKGHLFEWIDDDMYWEDGRVRYEEDIMSKGCPCGSPAVYRYYHYGDINDCLEEGKKLKEIGEEVLLVAFPEALNESGERMKGVFRKIRLPVYGLIH